MQTYHFESEIFEIWNTASGLHFQTSKDYLKMKNKKKTKQNKTKQ